MLLDNNALQENNKRLGTTATIVQEFRSDTRFYGAEYGNAPVGPIHLSSTGNSKNIRGSAFWSHFNSSNRLTAAEPWAPTPFAGAAFTI